MIELSKLIFEQLRKDKDLILYRGRNQENAAQVLVLAPAKEKPEPESLKRLEHEYSLRESLDPGWAVRPVAMTSYWNRPVLMLEDPGGIPLDQALIESPDLTYSLRLGINLARAIGHVHHRELIHKDIKPANVLVHPATGDVWLTGFGIASRLPSEPQSPDPPEFIAGTLAYMGPEQTGRMNRSTDCRADLYSFGVTLYEMLTGSLPFSAANAMEWVHCQVARRPIPPHERAKGIPETLSAIVLRLLAKTPEERYQTAAGVESDLRRCLAEWEKLGRISPFGIGAHDASDRLWIPERLYGRDREVKVLLNAFERVVSGNASRLALVSGYSGIGKSSVVNELQKAIVLPRGIFISGKFDQQRRDIPYATLAQAFQSLVRQILGKNEDEVDYWRAVLRRAVGQNGQLIVSLIPQLELIIGKQPPVLELPPQEAQNRFQAVFRRFLCVFAQKEHPLTLFLDDLQWLDAATISFIEHLLTHPEVRHLLIVGAYRNNEVSPSHPLSLTLGQIRKAGVSVDEIVLKPLSLKDVSHFIADALRCERVRSDDLARLIHKKTAGNPFFVIQFLTALAEEHLVEFDARKTAWQWDLARIQTRGFTDNVVELMISKLRRFPVPTQEMLKQLACLGDNATTSTLAIVSGTTEEEVRRAIWEAVQAGLVLRLPGSYKFLHDRVQEAAYSLIPGEQRAEVHLRIGRLLIGRMSQKEITELIFEVVNQLNRAVDLIENPEERLSLLQLNVIAGMKARAAIAYTSARNYFALAEALLSLHAWDERYQETFDLYFAFSECEYLIGNFAAADKLFDLLLDRALSNLDRAKVYGLRMKLYQVAGKYDEGVTVALEALRLFGVTLPESDAEIAAASAAELAEIPINLRGRRISEVVDSPLAADPTVRAIINLLVEAVPCAYIGRPKLFPLISPKAVNYSLRYGHTEQSSFAYGVFALMLVSLVDDLATAFEYSEMSLRLNEKLKNPLLRGTLLHLHGDHVNFWRRHISTGIPILEQAFLACLEVGDLVYAGFLAFETVWQVIEKGDPLADVLAFSTKYAAFARESHNDAVYETIRLEQQFIASLQGRTKSALSFEDSTFDEEACFAAIVKATFGCGIVFYRIMQQILAFIHGRYPEALEAAARAEPILSAAMAMPIEATYHFCHALTLTALYPTASPAQQAEYRLILDAKLQKLQLWAENCPENYSNRLALLLAEIARIEGRDLDAMRLYDEAIRSAHQNGFIQIAAMANEIASRFYAAHGLQTIAQTYIKNARYCYLRWGAFSKVKEIDQDYSFPRDELTSSSVETIETAVEQLDLGTVIKVSQAVSGEIVLEKLVQTLMTIAIEHAGAERGLLILPYGEEYRIAAEAQTGRDEVEVKLQQDLVAPSDLPDSLLRYVIRTRQSVILDDASIQNQFSEDEYVRAERPRSILCLPLVKQAKLVGVLYLENNLAPGVFTPARITVLKLLASEAAISLENTRLYRDLEEREAKIRRLFDANIVGIFIWNLKGQIIEANEAFLRMVGFGREDLIAGRLGWRDMVPTDWRGRIEQALAELEATGVIQPFEMEYFRKEGGRVPVLAGSAFFERSRSEGVAFVLDLTERKRGEEALRRSEAFLAQAQRLSQTGSFSWKIASGELIWSNETFRIMGYNRTAQPSIELVFERVHPQDAQLVQDVLRQAARAEMNIDFEHRLLMPDGSVKHVHVVLEPINPDAANREFLGTVMDVTARKEAAEAVSKAQAELAHIARVMMVGELTASIAHEVNQPLAGMLLNANAGLRWLTRESPDLTEVREAIHRIIRDGNRAGEVISRIRALFKKAPAAKEPVELNEMIQEVLAITQAEFQRNRVSLVTQFATDLPLIVGDRVQLQQVTLNLVVNAIEAMRGIAPGLRELFVSSQEVTRLDGESQLESTEDLALSRTESTYALITVRDSGPGLDPSNLKRVFETFYTTKSNGMGMGLAISRSIVEAHGGRLWARVNSPHGAIFQFTLPAVFGGELAGS